MTLTCVNCKRVYQDHVTVLKSPTPGFGRCQKCRGQRGTANGRCADKRAKRAWQEGLTREASR